MLPRLTFLPLSLLLICGCSDPGPTSDPFRVVAFDVERYDEEARGYFYRFCVAEPFYSRSYDLAVVMRAKNGQSVEFYTNLYTSGRYNGDTTFGRETGELTGRCFRQNAALNFTAHRSQESKRGAAFVRSQVRPDSLASVTFRFLKGYNQKEEVSATTLDLTIPEGEPGHVRAP